MKIVSSVLSALIVAVCALWGAGYFMTNADDPYQASLVTKEQKTAAQAYLDANLEPMPDGWLWETFEPDLDITLETGFLEAPGGFAAAKGTIIFLPGFTSPLELYSYGYQRFHDAGFNIAAISYRGQGRSTRSLAFTHPEKGYVEDYTILADDVERFVAATRTRVGREKPIFVFGNSKGGHIALRMAGDLLPDIKAYALKVPMVHIKTGDFPYWFAGTASWFWSQTGLGTNYAPGQSAWKAADMKLNEPTACASNPARANFRDAIFALNEDLRVKDTTNQWVSATVSSTKRLLDPASHASITAPVFMVTDGWVLIVSTPSSEAFCKALGDCTFRRFEDADHCIQRGPDADRAAIYDDVIRFFESHR